MLRYGFRRYEPAHATKKAKRTTKLPLYGLRPCGQNVSLALGGARDGKSQMNNVAAVLADETAATGFARVLAHSLPVITGWNTRL